MPEIPNYVYEVLRNGNHYINLLYNYKNEEEPPTYTVCNTICTSRLMAYTSFWATCQSIFSVVVLFLELCMIVRAGCDPCYYKGAIHTASELQAKKNSKLYFTMLMFQCYSLFLMGIMSEISWFFLPWLLVELSLFLKESVVTTQDIIDGKLPASPAIAACTLFVIINWSIGFCSFYRTFYSV